MNHESLRELGQQLLQNLRSVGGSVGHWKDFLANYHPQAQHPDDPNAWLTCILALEGVASDNFGVGAILLDADGQVVAQGYNQVFHPYFRSDRHAEMVVLEGWENSRPQVPWSRGLTLFTSLEPCPMCLVRLLNADVSRVLFAAKDDPGGMVQRLNQLPPAWLEFAQGKTFTQAQCSPELADAAGQIFQINLQELNARIRRR
ncbi:MAG TPA: nucleoside deaminase [Gemmataceae bacterium]